VKELELSNPARKAIAYTARLEGHRDFSTEASLVRIDAKVPAFVGQSQTHITSLAPVDMHNLATG
jgi:hypothetical protein